ncbi:hypothetical protein BKA70DRAFT_840262 [Coprinopsis sp. MPI-PUGE-AT-0042]|nr:hypothetical protein BKA70DRAFT_840262 [Coprinopsis sp. MPI-PUGE-AT-0042]
MEGSKTDNLMHHLQRTYYDLFENLHRVLKRLGKPLSTNPIGDFTRGFIRLLMTKHVGPKPVYANPPTPSRIGCGCVYCNTLDDFLMNSERVARYSIGQARRKHLETRLRRLPGVCEWETERGDPGKASTLVITKNPALAEPAQWKWRANEMADMLFWIAPRDHHLDGVLAPGELEAIQESLQGGEPYEIPTKPTSALVQGPADTSTMRRGLKRAAEQFTNDPEKRKRRDQA